MVENFLGTNPYSAINKRKQQLLTQLKYDNKNEEDFEFSPLSFKSTRDHRINFQRLNDKDEVLNKIKDDNDSLGFDSSDWVDSTITLNIDHICEKVAFFSDKEDDTISIIHRARPRGQLVSLDYYGEEEKTDIDQSLRLKVPFGRTGVVFKKRRKGNREMIKKEKSPDAEALEFTFVSFPERKTLTLKPGQRATIGIGEKERLIHFRPPEDKYTPRLAKADYELLMKNFSILSLPEKVDPVDLYLFLQDRIHFEGVSNQPDDKMNAEFESLCALMMRSFKSSRFVDGNEETTGGNPLAGRTRRKITDIHIPRWLIKHVTYNNK